MSKCYHPKRIDLKDIREASDYEEPYSLTLVEADGSPDVSGVTRIVLGTGLTLTDDEDGTVIITATAPGGGGSHGAHFSLPIPATIVPPGPKNLSGGNWTITAVNYVSDGEITSATILGAGTISVAAGGNGDGVDVTGLNITVADGERLTVTGVTYPDPTDANYLAVTWCIESAA